MADEKRYRILAGSIDEFAAIEEGYKDLIKHFTLKTDGNLLIQKVFSLQENKKRIDISPLIDFKEIQEVTKYSSDLEWNLMSSTREAWFITGKDYNYHIHAKKLDVLL